VGALLSTRKALLKKTVDLANEVRGLLKVFGLRLPKTVQHGSSASALFYPLIIWGCGSTRKAVLLEKHGHGAHLGSKMNRV
jgi:hypothetical protein